MCCLAAPPRHPPVTVAPRAPWHPLQEGSRAPCPHDRRWDAGTCFQGAEDRRGRRENGARWTPPDGGCQGPPGRDRRAPPPPPRAPPPSPQARCSRKLLTSPGWGRSTEPLAGALPQDDHGKAEGLGTEETRGQCETWTQPWPGGWPPQQLRGCPVAAPTGYEAQLQACVRQLSLRALWASTSDLESGEA